MLVIGINLCCYFKRMETADVEVLAGLNDKDAINNAASYLIIGNERRFYKDVWDEAAI